MGMTIYTGIFFLNPIAACFDAGFLKDNICETMAQTDRKNSAGSFATKRERGVGTKRAEIHRQ